MGIEFAPLNVPLARRLQTLAATAYILAVNISSMSPITVTLLAYVIVFTQYSWLGLAYVAFWYGEGRIGARGGRPSNWVRNWALWRYVRDYYPIKLVKTVDLDSSKNYLFCSFPHGILYAGSVTSFGTEALGISKVLPGMKTTVITVMENFNRPFHRDLVLALGFCGASAESLTYLLSEPRGGNAVVLMVGGAGESLLSKPRTYRLILKNRKGFIKIALKTGASLVPVFSFGETDIYDQVESPRLLRVQNSFRKVTGLTLPVLRGRGFFQYSFGSIPRRAPITTVIGNPIHLEKVREPTAEQVDILHQKFKDKLTSLFEAEKHKHLENADEIFLEFV